MKATRSLIYEVKIFTFEKRVEDTALGNMVENEFIDYTIWLFDDMLLWAKLKKDKYKYAGRITMDKLNLNPVQNIPKESKKNSTPFLSHFFHHSSGTLFIRVKR